MSEITVPIEVLEDLHPARWTVVAGTVGEGIDSAPFALGVSHAERLVFILLDEGEEAGAYAIRLDDLLNRVLDVHRPNLALVEAGEEVA